MAIKKRNVELVVIGGGPAGMAAALKAKRCGVKQVMIVERDFELGGILPQCIHNGFGLHYFKADLTGPEFAERLIRQVEEEKIEVLLDTFVLDINADRKIVVTNRNGVSEIHAGAVILAMGCRERARGAINICGTRPAGVMTAGTAQRYINIEGYMPGKDVVILGSGDIGMIMARRMTLEGAKVHAVIELMPYYNGLPRNKAQCLDDFDIPLHLSHTITRIVGKERVEGVYFAEVDKKLKPVPGTERLIKCDTLLLSVGLIPENELSKKMDIDMNALTGGALVNEWMETSVPGVFACGNAVHVHDLVDFVCQESEVAGEGAARFLRGEHSESSIKLTPGEGIRYIVPNFISGEKDVKAYVRVLEPAHDVRLGFEGVEASFKKPVVKPSEMLELNLKGRRLSALKGKSEVVLTVACDA